jgi:phosphonoacetaldehyde dehydrogenase
VLYEAGLPPEMLSVVTGWPGDIGDAMMIRTRTSS